MPQKMANARSKKDAAVSSQTIFSPASQPIFSPAPAQIDPEILQGFLAVKGSGPDNLKWDERLWKLDARSLRCFSMDSSRRLLGTYSIQDVVNLKADIHKNEFNFEVKGRSGLIRLRSRELRESQMWYESLKNAIEAPEEDDDDETSIIESSRADSKMSGRVRQRCGTEMRELHKALDKAVKKLRDKILLQTRQGNKELLDQFFDQMDVNGDGELSLDEFRHVLRTTCKLSRSEISDDQVNMLFDLLDTDANREAGTVSVQEFRNFLMDTDGTTDARGRRRGSRMEQMYADYALKKAKLEEQNLLQAEAEKERRLNQKTMSHAEMVETTTRLYNDSGKYGVRLDEKRQRYDDQQARMIEANRVANRPTLQRSQANQRSQSNLSRTSAQSVEQASSRLHEDGRRRAESRERRMSEHQAMEQQHLRQFHPPPRRTCRHEVLFKEAAERKNRLEDRSRRFQDEEDNAIRAKSVPCGEDRWPDPGRLEALHAMHAEKEKNLAKKRAELSLQEQERTASILKQVNGEHGRSGRRPSVTLDLRSPRSVFHKLAQERNVQEQKSLKTALSSQRSQWTHAFGGGFRAPDPETKKLVLAGKHDHLLNTIIQPLQMRCGYNAETDCIWDEENRPLAVPLEKVVSIYSAALGNCETSDGFMALCNRPSERLHKEFLVSDVEGFARNIEPDPIIQVQDSLEDLLATAEKAQVLLKQLLSGRNAADWKKGTKWSHPDAVPIALFALDNGIKSYESAHSKARVRQGPSEGNPGCFKHLLDLARVLIVFSSCDMLVAGLDQIKRRFEVVDVRNYFQKPARCGARFVEVLVVIQVPDDSGNTYPHVCELRLEEMCFHKAREQAAPFLRQFTDAFHGLYDRANRDCECLEGFVRTTLQRPDVSKNLRVFKCHFAKRYGSTISGWRQEFSGQRLLDFKQFRSVCQKMKVGERAAEFWQAFDPGLGGTISIFDLDPEAVSTLIMIRSRLIALQDQGNSGETALASKHGKELGPDVIFARLCFLVRPATPSKLELKEFRSAMKPLGCSLQEADKIFTYLDISGHSPPASVNASDIAWLMSLPSLVDIEEVMLSAKDAPSTSEALRAIAWSRGTARYNKRDQVLRWSVFKENLDLTEKSSTSGGAVQNSSEGDSSSSRQLASGDSEFNTNAAASAEVLNDSDREPAVQQLPIDSGYSPRTAAALAAENQRLQAVDDAVNAVQQGMPSDLEIDDDEETF
jgi:hypothetical protein